jgi:hypothetical protein
VGVCDAPLITLSAAALVIASGVLLWRQTRRVAVKGALVAAVAVSFATVFSRRLDGRVLDLVAEDGAAPFRLLDTTSGSKWDSGPAVAGPYKGQQRVRLPFLEEYWFDWKTYHPSTGVARHTF